MRMLTLAGNLCLALASLAALAAPAGATRDYARKEGQKCIHCHVSDEGSGPRNERGKEYEANGHRFGVESWSSDANSRKYLRARSALLATWYGESARLLDELEEVETLPGGLALIESSRGRFSIFRRTWLRAARKLLGKGSRGLPNALKFLAKVESQFPGSKEAGAATKLLDGKAADDEKTAAAVEAARGRESVRLVLLAGRTEYQLGDFDRARELLDRVLADPLGAVFETDVREILAVIDAR